MLQFYVVLCCIESNVAHKVQRYIHLFVASGACHAWLVSDVEGVIPASSPCGLRSKAGGRTEVFSAEGTEYAESENQDSFVLFVSFVVKQFCTSARVLVLHLSLQLPTRNDKEPVLGYCVAVLPRWKRTSPIGGDAAKMGSHD